MLFILAEAIQQTILKGELPMSDEFNKQDYEQKIAELEKQLEEAKKTDDTFDDLKQKYEKIIEEKDNKIQELNQTVENNKNKIDETVDNLNKEVQEKLEQTEAYKELQETVAQLEKERAEATVDAYIQKGILLPAQKDSAVKLCLNDNETFLNLYKDAPPIVNVKEQKSKKINADISRIRDYLKK